MSRYIRSLPTADSSAPNAPSLGNYKLIIACTNLVYFALSPFAVLCLTLLYVLEPRPFPSWTLSRQISTGLAKLSQCISGWWIPPPPEDWDDWGISPPGQSFLDAQVRRLVSLKVITLQPVDKKYIIGIADVQGVQSVQRAGFWISPRASLRRNDEPAKKGEKVIMHIHGGGYIRGHPMWTTFPMDIANATGLRCLSVNYRKTLSASTAFPAPLLDVLAGYLYLTQTLGFSPRDVIILGESAGAHLALFLSQYLRDLGLPQAGYLFLSSPWADFTLTYANSQTQIRKAYCHLTPFRLRRAVKSAMRYYTPSFLDAGYASPAKMISGGWDYLVKEQVRVYVHYGGKELFCVEIEALGKGLKGDGVDVRMRLDPNGVHTSAMSGEAGEVFKKDVLEILS
ncbi:uncharacterized protein I303_107011 [Kwoniella dejecticola CBS 10117]|uniref:Alpha/beta hydrolase fold-3 domain-containing protein n=1 Tax=Kwoniella dejecticola CBS 10117 TaxID=1296121 RepID=A0A1A5ZYH3_9TREE|nr:uncharacterized protein I303_06412 [Kwoniella dejecticola CBS 10117]OBR82855.1 hypothetical protein I303_06412 [Kwoniella dejecticola CBS 10117]